MYYIYSGSHQTTSTSGDDGAILDHFIVRVKECPITNSEKYSVNCSLSRRSPFIACSLKKSTPPPPPPTQCSSLSNSEPVIWSNVTDCAWSNLSILNSRLRSDRVPTDKRATTDRHHRMFLLCCCAQKSSSDARSGGFCGWNVWIEGTLCCQQQFSLNIQMTGMDTRSCN